MKSLWEQFFGKPQKKAKMKVNVKAFNKAFEEYQAGCKTVKQKMDEEAAELGKMTWDDTLAFAKLEQALKKKICGNAVSEVQAIYWDDELVWEKQSTLSAIEEFDRLTAQGYKLNLLTGRYEK